MVSIDSSLISVTVGKNGFVYGTPSKPLYWDYIILYYTILYYIILYYTILYYIILYHKYNG